MKNPKKTDKKKTGKKKDSRFARVQNRDDDRGEAASNDAAHDGIRRLNRIVGQIEGIKRMLEEERQPAEMLTQAKAVHSALRAFELRLLQEHLYDAVEDALRTEKRKSREQKITDMVELFRPV